MRFAGGTPYGLRIRTLIVLLWRSGLRISEALALAESDLHRATGGVLVRAARAASGGGRHGPLGLGAMEPWLEYRVTLPVGSVVRA